jgi:hypothetical protein
MFSLRENEDRFSNLSAGRCSSAMKTLRAIALRGSCLFEGENRLSRYFRFLLKTKIGALVPCVVDLLAANPFLTITGAAAQLKLAFTTAQRAVDRLERAGILQPVSDAKRDRVYCARGLLDILEEPAQLRPLLAA